MGALSQRIIAKVSGQTWEQLRGQVMHIGRLLLDVSANAKGELLASYAKFTISSDPSSPVYAVLWLKNSKSVIVGLALPEEYDAEELGPAPPRTFYKGLNKYFVVERDGAVPKGLAEWAGLAYQNTLPAQLQAGQAGPNVTTSGPTNRLGIPEYERQAACSRR